LNRGILLAFAGALLLTPDSLFMRWSELDGGAMLAWRASLSGIIYIVIGYMFGGSANAVRQGGLRLFSFWILVLCQISNATFFAFGIAIAPVAIVLVAVATVPIFSVILGFFFLGERPDFGTWVIIGVVFLGIALSVLGDIDPTQLFNPYTVLGAVFGLLVAISLAINFVIIRKNETLPFELALGFGAIIAGLGAFVLFPAARSLSFESAFYISLTGLIILPISFYLLSYASRFTSAANVSMLMLLETVLGPFWVWLGVGEAPGIFGLIGGGIVIAALFYFLLRQKDVSEPRAEPVN
ncbi:MAG: DMT family transporter, partial [Rhodobacteraceae bacterium]|nr:DMT family transporter [Paracoccaceae bacterium]